MTQKEFYYEFNYNKITQDNMTHNGWTALFELCVYLYVIPPELQQCGKSSFHFAEELVEEGQLSHTILI